MGICGSRHAARNSTEQRSTGIVQPLNLDQFELRRVIGKGAFGKVRTVTHKESSKFYALKYISKSACIEQQAVANIVRERKILEMLQHPLICNMRYAFQDVDYLYLVSDLMLGGDLRFHLLRKSFTEATIRHWIAEIASALSYCHSRSIIHRDVKPDNILLSASGHARLADFNISTQIKNDVLPTSRSGSLFYMAPEVLEGCPYDGTVDYWSLGVVMYECVYGKRPFDGKSNLEVTQAVCGSKVTFEQTSPPVTEECNHAISQLLQPRPQDRCRDLQCLKALPFFCQLDWERLEAGESQPIFVPGDGNNFDAAWELEEILLQDMPLENRRRKSPKCKAMDEKHKDYQQTELMNKHFTDFDYTVVTSAANDEKLDLCAMLETQESYISLPQATLDTDSTGVIVLDKITINVPPKEPISLSTTPALRTGLFRTKSKKRTALPTGVLSLKPGARVAILSSGASLLFIGTES